MKQKEKHGKNFIFKALGGSRTAMNMSMEAVRGKEYNSENALGISIQGCRTIPQDYTKIRVLCNLD